MSKTLQKVQELKTLRDFIRYGASLFNRHRLFFGHGTDNALDEAAWLVLRTLHLPHDLPEVYLDANLTEEEKQRILERFERRIKTRKPAAYLLQEAVFCGLTFYVDERVMVPRSPIGEWIGKRFAPWLEGVEVRRILDLGTGSGCLAIAAAYAFPEAEVDAVDLSPEALEVAKINIKWHGLEDQVFPILSDLFEKLKGQEYQLILANPPYVPKVRYERLPYEYTHEPREALLSPDEGLFHVKRILAEAGDFLSEEGILVVEVGATAAELERCFPEVPFLWLELERGGEGVFLLPAPEVKRLILPFGTDIRHS